MSGAASRAVHDLRVHHLVGGVVGAHRQRPQRQVRRQRVHDPRRRRPRGARRSAPTRDTASAVLVRERQQQHFLAHRRVLQADAAGKADRLVRPHPAHAALGQRSVIEVEQFLEQCGFESAELVVHRAQDWPTPSLSQPGSCGGGGRLMGSNRSSLAFFSPELGQDAVADALARVVDLLLGDAPGRDRHVTVVRDPDDRFTLGRRHGRANARQGLRPDRRRVLLLRSLLGPFGVSPNGW